MNLPDRARQLAQETLTSVPTTTAPIDQDRLQAVERALLQFGYECLSEVVTDIEHSPKKYAAGLAAELRKAAERQT